MSKAKDMMERFGSNIAATVALRSGGVPTTPPQMTTDKYSGAVKARTFAELPVEAILCAPQPRTEFDAEDLNRLAASIRRFGQLAPIRVRHDQDRGAWVVLVGERRLRACKLAGLERVRVEFVEREMTEADILAEQVVENAVRADLKPVEAAHAYRRLMDLNGWDAQQLAETLGIEPTSVYRALGLLRLPDDVAARVEAGQIKPTAAYEISKLQIADDQRVVAERIIAEGLDHASTVAEVKRRRASGQSKARGRGGKPRKITEKVYRTEAGPRVTIAWHRGINESLIIAALREALACAEAEQASDEAEAA